MFSGELTLKHAVVSMLILLAFAGLTWLFRTFFERAAHRLAHKGATGLDNALTSAFEKPATFVVVLAGLGLSALALPLEPEPRLYISRGLSTTLLLLGIYSAVALVNAVLRWYARAVLPKRRDAGLSSGVLEVFRWGTFAAGAVAAIALGLNVWGAGPVAITDWMAEHGWRIVVVAVLSLAIVVGTGEFVPRFVVTTISRRAGESDEEVRKRAATLSRVLVGTGQVAALLVAAFMMLSELDINIAPILAGVGVAGIAVGFGAQSVVKDILAGLFIIMENQYCVGDVVRIADIAGLVEDINLRRTVLRDLDGIVHVVPNGEIRVASNLTKEYSRVNLNVSVAYDTDLDAAIAAINRVGRELAEDPKWATSILTPPQVLRVDNLGDSGIEIKILGDTKPLRQWDVTGELRLRLKKALDKERIEIPWPHTKVYFGNSPPSPGVR